jgi:hypothetical protein
MRSDEGEATVSFIKKDPKWSNLIQYNHLWFISNYILILYAGIIEVRTKTKFI